MGQVIAGRFELIEHIASGASGAIWLATDRRRETLCAAKVLRQKDSGELLRFVREQGVRLDHPHLATPYGWAAEDDDVAIAMPLVRGGTLESALADHGAFSAGLTAALLMQLLDGLSHVHRAGWLHRDVKPANILLEATGTGRPHLRLGDFGTALRAEHPRFTEVGLVHGTPGYIAPEISVGGPPTMEGDLYAAGVVGLRMLFPAVRTDDDVATAREQLNPQHFPEPLVRTLAALTDVEPNARRAAAQRAMDLLAPAAHLTTHHTAAGEPFEVFDQLPGPVAPPAFLPAPVPEPAADRTVIRGTATPPPAPARQRATTPWQGPALVVALGLVFIMLAVIAAVV